MGNKSEALSSVDEHDRIEWGHNMMKDIKIVKKKNGDEEVMEATFAMGSKKDYEEWVKALEKSPCHDSQVGFNPIKHQFVQKGVCGSGGFVKIEYQNFPYMLLSQIFNREVNNYKKFDESELWYLLFCLADIGNAFHMKGLKVGDIQPSNIFMSKDGNVVVAHHHSWPEEKTNYEKSLHLKQITYLSPEQINDIHVGRPQTVVNIGKAESFSVGLTMIDAILIDTCKKIYDNKMEINLSQLNSFKREVLATPCSDIFKCVILNLVEPQPKNRVSLIDLHKWLLPYSDQINHLDDFIINQSLPIQMNTTALQNGLNKIVNADYQFGNRKHSKMEFTFNNENRPKQMHPAPQSQEGASIINQGLAGVISTGISHLEPKNYEQGTENKNIFRPSQTNDAQKLWKPTLEQQHARQNFIMQVRNSNEPHQPPICSPFSPDSNFQRLQSPQFRHVQRIELQPKPIPVQYMSYSDNFKHDMPYSTRQQPIRYLTQPPPTQSNIARPLIPAIFAPLSPRSSQYSNFPPPNSQPVFTAVRRNPEAGSPLNGKSSNQSPMTQLQAESNTKMENQIISQTPSYSQPVITQDSATHKEGDGRKKSLVEFPSTPIQRQSPEKRAMYDERRQSNHILKQIGERIKYSKQSFPSHFE